MEVLLGYVMLYLIIIFGSIFITSVTNKKIEKSIAINMCLIILTLYLFGAINCLKIGVYFVSVISIVLGIIGIKKKKGILKLIATPGFAFFSIVYFILMLTTYNKQLVDWDHFTYRSFNAKFMYYTNSMIKDYEFFYPPASTLLEYFFMKIIGVYRQGIEAFAIQIFGISLLLPFYENVKKKTFAKLAIGIIIICIPAVFTNLVFYESAYIDATLGLILGYALYIYFTEKSYMYRILAVGIPVCVSSIMKPFGIVLVGVLILILAIYEFLHNKYVLKRKFKLLLKSKELKTIVIITIMIGIVFVSWEIVQKLNAKQGKAATLEVSKAIAEEKGPVKYVLDSIITTVFGKYQENNDAADSNRGLIEALYKVNGIYTPLKLSLASTSILFIIAYIYYYYKIKDEKFKFQTVSVAIGLILYLGLLQVAYITKFSDSEMMGHNGIDRYFTTYLLAMLYLIFSIVINNLNKKQYNSKQYAFLLAIIILITPIQSICDATITSGIYNINSIEYINSSKNIADKIDKYVEKDAKIITISQTSKTKLYNIMLKYYLYPEHKTSVLNDIGREYIKKIQEMLKENDYIYIFSKDEELDQVLKEVSNNVEEVKNKTLYKIEYSNNGQVVLIEQQYVNEMI